MIAPRIMRWVSKGIDLVIRGATTILAVVHHSRFGVRERNDSFGPFGFDTYETIPVGGDVNFGYRPILKASRSNTVIDEVMFGPCITICGGNRRIDLPGRTLIRVTDAAKRRQDDPGVEIENDASIGTNATILASVRIGEGAFVSSGAVVTPSLAPLRRGPGRRDPRQAPHDALERRTDPQARSAARAAIWDPRHARWRTAVSHSMQG